MDEHIVTMQWIQRQLRRWPELELRDILKGLHQSVFGCGHFVGESAWERLLAEIDTVSGSGLGAERLPGPWFRFHLVDLAAAGISLETLYRLFVLSGRKPTGDAAALERKLAVLLDLARSGVLPWTVETIERETGAWREAGFPACSHSEPVHRQYRPAYRVLHQDFLRLLPLLAEIDRLLRTKGGGIVAIEGGSAAGKTTLAACLSEIYPCSVFHMDDFFLQLHQRTAERLAESGGNVDRERFLQEVLLPVKRGETVHLQRYDCHTQSMQPPIDCLPQALTIVEGVYSMHPDLAEHYDLSVFLTVDPKVQCARIEVRNEPELQVLFFNAWIPLENRYFRDTDVRRRCDLILEGDT